MEKPKRVALVFSMMQSRVGKVPDLICRQQIPSHCIFTFSNNAFGKVKYLKIKAQWFTGPRCALFDIWGLVW